MVRWLVYPQFVAISTGMVLQTEILRQKMPQNGMVKFAVFMLEKKMPKCVLIFGRSFFLVSKKLVITSHHPFFWDFPWNPKHPTALGQPSALVPLGSHTAPRHSFWAPESPHPGPETVLALSIKNAVFGATPNHPKLDHFSIETTG